jgi:hypothetical protein
MTLSNISMASALKVGHCLDVRREGRELSEGVFQLKRFIDHVDYCDTLKERWIWSIGKNVHDGRIQASVDTRYYNDPNWECLFLR